MDWQNHQVKFANIATATSGANELVAAVTGKAIRVLSLVLVNAGVAVNVYFLSASTAIAFGDGTKVTTLDKTGATGMPAILLPFNPAGWFTTASGAALNLNLSGAVNMTGCLSYVEV